MESLEALQLRSIKSLQTDLQLPIQAVWQLLTHSLYAGELHSAERKLSPSFRQHARQM